MGAGSGDQPMKPVKYSGGGGYGSGEIQTIVGGTLPPAPGMDTQATSKQQPAPIAGNGTQKPPGETQAVNGVKKPGGEGTEQHEQQTSYNVEPIGILLIVVMVVITIRSYFSRK